MRTEGRCPDCGALVLVERRRQSAVILPHACESRACGYGTCRARGLREEMVQFDSGEWYCPPHALLLAAKALLSSYQAEGEADWTAISEIIAEALPGIVAKIEARVSQSPHRSSAG